MTGNATTRFAGVKLFGFWRHNLFSSIKFTFPGTVNLFGARTSIKPENFMAPRNIMATLRFLAPNNLLVRVRSYSRQISLK